MKSTLANGTIVIWDASRLWSVGRRLPRTGIIEGYVWADMPWKLYQIRECETDAVALVHPDHIVKTYGEPHRVG